MSWRIVLVSNPCKLSVRNNQLYYQPTDGDNVTLPLEDISAIILETKQATLTSYLVSAMADYNIVLFSCDESHMPSGIFTPFHQHSRYAEMAWLQMDWTEPFKKRMWQKVVQAKINNQIQLLKHYSIEEASQMEFLIEKVQSGDNTNIEAFAAKLYWNCLFNEFKRKDQDIRNMALNYGYSIIRGAIARYLVCSGFMPCFGIHHANKLNAFNLVDDLIEPFRPFVDNIVFKNINENNYITDDNKLSIKDRQTLINVLTQNCLYNDECITILKACELISFSLASATKEKDYNLLHLPSLINKI